MISPYFFWRIAILGPNFDNKDIHIFGEIEILPIK